MIERLIINNFLGIRKLDIPLKKINIFNWPQASGKSVCAKLLYYFKEFVLELVSTVENEIDKRQFDTSCAKKFEEYFPLESWGKEAFSIRYEVDEHFIQIVRDINKSSVDLSYSDSYKKELAALRRLFKKLINKEADSASYQSLEFGFKTRIELFEHMKNTLGEQSTSSQIFIPAGRSFFSNLQNNIFSFLSSNNSLDPFLEEFGSIYERMKNIRPVLRHRTKNEDIKIENEVIRNEIERLIEETLCGKYLYEKGKDFLELSDGRKISISNASSGQQETLPLAIMLSMLPFLYFEGGGRTIYIEEPEAHLFPTAQRNIVELIATVFNSDRDNFQFVITTHSPYVLTATNNLIQAGLIYREADSSIQRKLKNIIPQHKVLYPEDIGVYSLINGICKTILSEETRLIDTNIIDAVSDELAIEFDKLLELA